MNREIKFRVWDNKNKCFCYCSPLTFISRNMSKILDGITRLSGQVFSEYESFYVTGDDKKKQLEVTHPSHKDFVIQQFTGLKDKNNKEIYEGDIVEYHKKMYRIQFCNSYACGGYRLFNYDETLETECDNWFSCKIIGNIFENPELLAN